MENPKLDKVHVLQGFCLRVCIITSRCVCVHVCMCLHMYAHTSQS